MQVAPSDEAVFDCSTKLTSAVLCVFVTSWPERAKDSSVALNAGLLAFAKRKVDSVALATTTTTTNTNSALVLAHSPTASLLFLLHAWLQYATALEAFQRILNGYA